MPICPGAAPICDTMTERAVRASFQEGEAVGVEQAAAVGGQAEVFVLDPAVDGPEGGQQPAPRVEAAL